MGRFVQIWSFLVDGQGYWVGLVLYTSGDKKKTDDTVCCRSPVRKYLFLFCLICSGSLHSKMVVAFCHILIKCKFYVIVQIVQNGLECF